MAAPLIIDGHVIGVLNVDADGKDAFSADDKELLVAAAEESARVIQIARLHEQIRAQSLKLETLYNVGQTITTVPTLGEVLDRIAAEVRSVMGAKVCSILLLDKKGENLLIEATAGAAQSYAKRPALSVEGTLVGRVVREGAPVVVADVRKAPEFSQRGLARREKLCSLLSVPIDYLGRTIGVLNIYTGKQADFGEAETSLLKALAGQSAVAIENARRTSRISEAEEQLRQSEKLSVLGALAAEIAHEIRNPITTVQMLAESLAGDFAQTDPRRRDVAVIQNKLGQMNRIVDQVLDMARAREVHAAPFDVREAIEETLFLAERRMATSGIELRRRFAEELPQAFGDRGQIEQALLNVILNGCQAMGQGGRLSVSASVKSSGNGQQIAIRVRDSGPGIPAAQMERIFAPFYTTRSEGVGMGLFVARRVMRAHHGDLTVRSRPGEGAVFEAALPAAPADPAILVQEDSGRA
jgi:signal transduction histidine kinase